MATPNSTPKKTAEKAAKASSRSSSTAHGAQAAPAPQAPPVDPHTAAIPEVMELMCEGLSLRKAVEFCGTNAKSFLTRIDADPALQQQYAQARARMLDVQAEELESIGEKAAQATDAVEVAGLRLQSDNRKWLLSKLAPKKYGDKLAVGGADDLPPLQTVHALSDAQLAQIAAQAVAK